MAQKAQEERSLSETVVKEAVGMGMESPLRDSILEAVEESEGRAPGRGPSLPLAGALFGAGAALGFLAGRQSPDLEETPLEDIEEPEIIEDVVEETTERAGEMGTTETATEEDGGSSRLPRLLLVLGALAGVAVLRRRLSSGEEEEWEPIEEFEPATEEETEEAEEEAGEAEAEEETSEEGEEEVEEE